MTKMNPVVHFEMPYENQKRLSKFYETVFGWQMQYMPKMGSYVLATTSPTDDKGMHKKKGAINGGFFPKGDYGTKPHLVIEVDDLQEHMGVVKKGGGKVLGEPMDIPGVGKFVMCVDTEGNRVGMLQAIEMQVENSRHGGG
jgi:hypothetical protein